MKGKKASASDHSSEGKLHAKKSKQTKFGLNILTLFLLVEKNFPPKLEKNEKKLPT